MKIETVSSDEISKDDYRQIGNGVYYKDGGEIVLIDDTTVIKVTLTNYAQELTKLQDIDWQKKEIEYNQQGRKAFIDRL